MNLVDAEDQLDFIQRVREYKKWFTDGWKERYKGVPLHFSDPDNPTFLALCDKLWGENPNACLMLQYVEGGKDVIQRYMRLSGAKGGGMDWRAFCTHHAMMLSAMKMAQSGVM